jgi:hypothetical protein
LQINLTAENFNFKIKTIAAIFLFIHAFANTVGFFVQWRIIKSNDMPYSTKLFFGKLDAGNAGIRIIGLLWLFIAIVYVFVGYGILTSKDWWITATIIITAFSFIFCIVGLPDTKMGVIANIIILVFIFLNQRFELIG